MSSARLEPSPTAPADGAGVVVAAMSGVVPSAPASPAAFGSSSSVSAGPPWSVGARVVKEFLGDAGVGSSGVAAAWRALPRLFLERAPECGIFFFSDGGLWLVDPTVVTTMEPGLSRILVSKWRGRSRRSCTSLVAGVGAERASELKSKRRGRRGAEVP